MTDAPDSPEPVTLKEVPKPESMTVTDLMDLFQLGEWRKWTEIKNSKYWPLYQIMNSHPYQRATVNNPAAMVAIKGESVQLALGRLSGGESRCHAVRIGDHVRTTYYESALGPPK
jgi:hypothetical protein